MLHVVYCNYSYSVLQFSFRFCSLIYHSQYNVERISVFDMKCESSAVSGGTTLLPFPTNTMRLGWFIRALPHGWSSKKRRRSRFFIRRIVKKNLIPNTSRDFLPPDPPDKVSSHRSFRGRCYPDQEVLLRDGLQHCNIKKGIYVTLNMTL